MKNLWSKFCWWFGDNFEIIGRILIFIGWLAWGWVFLSIFKEFHSAKNLNDTIKWGVILCLFTATLWSWEASQRRNNLNTKLEDVNNELEKLQREVERETRELNLRLDSLERDLERNK